MTIAWSPDDWSDVRMKDLTFIPRSVWPSEDETGFAHTLFPKYREFGRIRLTTTLIGDYELASTMWRIGNPASGILYRIILDDRRDPTPVWDDMTGYCYMIVRRALWDTSPKARLILETNGHLYFTDEADAVNVAACSPTIGADTGVMAVLAAGKGR